MLQRRKYRLRPSVSDVTAFVLTASDERLLAVGTDTTPPEQLPTSAVASRVSSPAKQLLKLGTIVG